MKCDLTSAIKDIRRDVDGFGERVVTLEDKADIRDSELSAMQQEIMRIHEQQVDLQTHLEDLKNSSRRHNVCIRGIATNTEAGDIFAFVTGLFNHILGNTPELDIKIDRAHRVGLGPPRAAKAAPADILVCVQDFRTKEEILWKARTMHPITYLNQSPTLYQDLAAITFRNADFSIQLHPTCETTTSHTPGATRLDSFSA